MRRLALLLCAVLLAGGISVPIQALHAKPVHALASPCNVGSDTPYVIYESLDQYQKKRTWVWDSYNGGNPPGHWVDTDLKVYHVYDGSTCWIGYYISAWTEDNTTANFRSHMRIWKCGSGPYEFDSPEAAVRNWRVITAGPGWPPVPGQWVDDNVTMWDGSNVIMRFWSYGSCGTQADNYGTY